MEEFLWHEYICDWLDDLQGIQMIPPCLIPSWWPGSASIRTSFPPCNQLIFENILSLGQDQSISQWTSNIELITPWEVARQKSPPMGKVKKKKKSPYNAVFPKSEYTLLSSHYAVIWWFKQWKNETSTGRQSHMMAMPFICMNLTHGNMWSLAWTILKLHKLYLLFSNM